MGRQMYTQFLFKNLQRIHYFGELGVDDEILLKCEEAVWQGVEAFISL
jgi:hypothetical protein